MLIHDDVAQPSYGRLRQRPFRITFHNRLCIPRYQPHVRLLSPADMVKRLHEVHHANGYRRLVGVQRLERGCGDRGYDMETF